MNGHGDDQDYAPMPDDDEMYAAMTYHEWLTGWTAAHSVDLAAGLPDVGDVADERDIATEIMIEMIQDIQGAVSRSNSYRRDLAERDEPTDEYMFDRAMSIGRGVLR